MNLEILLILIITVVACTTIGSFLVLRKMSMITDAISHTVLLGIVIGFFITKNLASPVLFVFASLFGLLTVVSVNLFVKTKKIKNDAAVGIVFPLFFALSIILITLFADRIHIDKDAVLLGQLVLAPLEKIEIFGIEITKSLFMMTLMLIINIIYVFVMYTKLKITTFDEEFAKLIGINNTLINYSLMCLVSTTAVAAFDVVGAILVISIMIVPPACAYLITKNLKNMIILSSIIGIFVGTIGTVFAYHYNISIVGVISTLNGLLLFTIVLFYPKIGFFSNKLFRARRKAQFEEELLLIHIYNHQNDYEELGAQTIKHHLNWDQKRLDKVVASLTSSEMIYRNDNMYHLTTKGKIYIYNNVQKEK